MKFPGRVHRDASDNHLIPLINVVFLMLIFFMVIGQIAPSDRFQVTAPTSRSQQPIDGNGITIFVTQNGSLAVNETEVTLETLIPTLLVSLDAAGRQQGDAAEIHIKADAALTTGQLTPLLERLRDNGKSKVRLMTWSAGLTHNPEPL